MNLIPLPPGSTVTIGRKSSSYVVVDCILVSNLHCKLSVTSEPPYKVTVRDLSRNGTWIKRSPDDGCNEASSTSRKLEKLPSSGHAKDLNVGDTIFLLAPSQTSAAACKYRLASGEGGKLFLERPSCSDGATSGKVKRKKSGEEGMVVSAKKRKLEADDDCVKASTSASTQIEDDEMGRCPTCRKLFHISVLPIHCPACQEPHGATRTDTVVTMEECVFCMQIFPARELDAHHEVCKGDSVKRDIESYGECPKCSSILPIQQLIEHSEKCGKTGMPLATPIYSTTPSKTCGKAGMPLAAPMYSTTPGKPCGKAGMPLATPAYSATPSTAYYEEVEVDGSKMLISEASSGNPASVGIRSPIELEQCAFCFQDFPLYELPAHYPMCAARKPKPDVTEHCVHCLALFPLDELIHHTASCPQRAGGGAVGSKDSDPLERCMHCFSDFPLSKMVEHSRVCTGRQNGAVDRFKNFIPSVHDLEPMTFLTSAQRKAVAYVMEKSKQDSEAVYPNLVKRVVNLGYSESDLKIALQWIRTDAPIIIHLNLDKCLHYLVKDTHYRNLFETGKGGGGNCKASRRDWENRIFNGIYGRAKAFDRVKYGVLNIVGDPRGVQCCLGYGDSFIQLKKVRLRATFASCDTAHSCVKLSCCEHYANVMYEYSNMELKAILDVATRRKSFLRSDVISHYKEVQIHGPVFLSENIDCIVVSERHRSCQAITEMLETFVKQNNCNLIWMEPTKSIDYPCFK